MRLILLASLLAGLAIPLPARAQTQDWSGPYFGIHVGGTDGIKATPWANASVEERRFIEEVPPELLEPGYCENPAGQSIPGLQDERSCETTNREWQETLGGCFGPGDQAFPQYANEKDCNGASSPEEQLNEWLEGTAAYCNNVNGPQPNPIPGLDTEEQCSGNKNGVWIPAIAAICEGPEGPLDFASESTCLAAGLQPAENYEWVAGSSQCINTENEQVVPGLDTEELCEGPNNWNDPVYSDLIPGFDSTLSAMQFATGAASRMGSIIAGGQAGYNWQRGNLVFGLEGDFAGVSKGTDPVHATAFADLSGNENFGTSLRADVMGAAKMEWFSTLRARAGFVVRDDFLPFVTGGVAFGQVALTGNARFSGQFGLGGSTEPFDVTASLDRSKTMAGYAIGGGLDYRLSEKVFLNFTYLHVNLGKLSSSASYTDMRSDLSGNSSSVSGQGGIDVNARFNVLRVGVNMQF